VMKQSIPLYRTSTVHCHSIWCDGKATPRQMAEAALAAGIKTLGLSGHSHTPDDPEYCMTAAGTEAYRAELAALQAEYAGRLDILVGLEWDLTSSDDPTRYEYFVGSAHYLFGRKTGAYGYADYSRAELRAFIDAEYGGDGLAAAEDYFANVAKAAQKKPTVLGHFDLIKKSNGDGSLFDESHPRYIVAARAALQACAGAGVVLEINTGGAARGYRPDFYPSQWILSEWRQLGGEVIITADAHSPEHLTFLFDEAAAWAKQAGFDRVMVLTKDGFVPCTI